MKLIDNAPKIMAQMLLDPEKDWSKYLPLVEITNADFDAARGLIQDHINDQSRYEQTLLWLNNYEKQKEQDHRWFLKKLEKELVMANKERQGMDQKTNGDEIWYRCPLWRLGLLHL